MQMETSIALAFACPLNLFSENAAVIQRRADRNVPANLS
jgi:hypothetical protein